MGMTGKSALYALAVAILMGSMAVAALADDYGTNMSEPSDSSLSAEPEVGVIPNSGEIREPMETGSVPDRLESTSDPYQHDSGEESSVEFGELRPGIDTSP